ncbi:MAG: hypothetical protein ACO3RV_07970 [Luteolibacter sp.]
MIDPLLHHSKGSAFQSWIAILAACLLTLSCANQKLETSSATVPRAQLSDRIMEKNGYTVDEDGNWEPQTDRRSPYEGKRAPTAMGGQANQSSKRYQTDSYEKKSWNGNSAYEVKAYQGNTDGSRFFQKSRHQGAAARESRQTARGSETTYQTDIFATESARENSAKRIERISDAETDALRGKQQAPKVIDWQQQRDLSLDESRSLLGR